MLEPRPPSEILLVIFRNRIFGIVRVTTSMEAAAAAHVGAAPTVDRHDTRVARCRVGTQARDEPAAATRSACDLRAAHVDAVDAMVRF
jgi:hypothetical protein